jgi:isovaleryl-CoA dehydrogenase
MTENSPLRARFAELGAAGLLESISELDRLEAGCHELARLAYGADELGVFLSVVATAGLALPILARGGESHRALHAAGLRGEAVIAVGITEREAGSDVRSMATSLRRTPTGALRLEGRKWHITNAPEADAAIVFAMDKTTTDTFLVAVVVRRGDRGVTFGPPLDLVGCKGSPTGEILLEDVEIPEERILGRREDGQKWLDLAFTRERVLAPWPLVGKMERVIEECLDHVETRVQFGRPLHEFQFVQDKILTAYSALVNARSLADAALRAVVSGRSVAVTTSLAKAAAADAAVEVFRAAIEVFGSYGVQSSARYGAYLADALCAQIAGGTRETHKKIVFGELRLDRARARRGRPSELFRSSKGAPS